MPWHSRTARATSNDDGGAHKASSGHAAHGDSPFALPRHQLPRRGRRSADPLPPSVMMRAPPLCGALCSKAANPLWLRRATTTARAHRASGMLCTMVFDSYALAIVSNTAKAYPRAQPQPTALPVAAVAAASLLVTRKEGVAARALLPAAVEALHQSFHVSLYASRPPGNVPAAQRGHSHARRVHSPPTAPMAVAAISPLIAPTRAWQRARCF